MNLKEYMELEGVKPIAIAYTLKVSQATIYNWLAGKIKPSLEHLQAIKKFTNNKVLPEDFYE